MRNLLILVFVVLIIALGYWAFFKGSSEDNLVACTMEAMQCPDGSYVGRTGPKCEFSPCPKPTYTQATSTTGGGNLLTGEINGVVMLGPTCPVMRDPPDPECNDRQYQTTLVARLTGTNIEISRQVSNLKGEFHFTLPSNRYDIVALGGNPFPTCGSVTVDLSVDEVEEISISCDTGIR